ncbi:MAG: hypothetical protein V3U06_04735 [Candidatus Binatia bacterium]
MRKKLFGWLILVLIVYPFQTQAQRRGYPHLQIFLLSSERQGETSFIAYWQDMDQLEAGPFPIGLLELAGLDVFLDLSYAGQNEELPSKARLRIKRSSDSTLQDRKGPEVLDQAADWIADRRVSKMFPDAPFIVIGHKGPSEGVRSVGRTMKEIQNKIIACDQKYHDALETTLNSMKGTASYDYAARVYPSCPL